MKSEIPLALPAAWLLSLVWLLPAPTQAAFPTPTNNQELTKPFPTAEESLAKMHLPPGFQATVFAAEPDVQNPIALCWDERGRLWVAENYTYSNSKERFDLKLRDRIVIFEDTDNDGHFDKRTVFAEDLQMLTSIERGFGGVYALCPPHLLWIPSQDDKPSGPPQILLDGFSTTAASRHTFANGLKWGPDGWLYGRIGISSTSWIGVPGTPQDQRLPTAGGIWRYHPTRKTYEPYCHGTTNPWGMDWNSAGDLFFVNTVIGHLWHALPGAHFKRMHGEDPYDHIYGLMDQTADHYHWDTGSSWTDGGRGAGGTDALGGGHAHVGMTIYQGTNWPAEYRGKVLTFNQHGRRLNVERLEREGSGYVAKHEPDILKSDDPWLRVTEVTYGPDGGVYLLDWSDIGECHDDDGVHRTSGRIYKITYGKPVQPKESDLTRLTDEALVNLQASENEWLVRMARWELRERNTSGKLTPAGREAATRFTTTPQSLAAFALQACLAPASASPACIPSTESIKSIPSTATPAQKAARLRLHQAGLLPHLPAATRLDSARELLSHGEDVNDRNFPLMCWYGIRDLPPADLAKLFEGCQFPLVRQFIARRVTEDIETAPSPLNTLLEQAATSADPTSRSDLLAGMAAALKGWRKATPPAAWEAFAASLKDATGEPASRLREFGVLFGSGQALDQVRAVALDAKADPEARRSALQSLADAKAPDLRAIAEKLLGDRALALAAVRALATFDDPAIAETILNRWRNFYPHEHPAVTAALVSRPAFARALLGRIAKGDLPRDTLTALHARQIRAFNDPGLTRQLTETWGEHRDSDAAKKKLIAELQAKLTPAALAPADPAQGRVLFNTLCATCHKLYGEGNALGPDLTGSGRHELGYLLENIADPSATVAADFRLNILTLKDGRTLNGLVRHQTDRTITLVLPGQELTLERADITKQEQLPTSLMPEGLLTGLSDPQLRHLIAYLMTNQQVPLPK